MKKKVYFTFLGTTQHRDKDYSLLTGFHEAVKEYAKTPEGSKIAEYLFDGVGCVGTEKNPTPGTYTLVGVDEKLKKKVTNFINGRAAYNEESSENDDSLYINEDNIENHEIRKQIVKFANALTLRLTRYCLTGEGIDSLMFEAILYLQKVIDENHGEMPEEISLKGFSRGADTCVRLAHILQDFCPDTKVNLFLIDPVPGPGRYHDKNSYIIPSNVENCQIVVMANEHLPILKPHDMDSYVFANMSTKVKYNNFVGNHGAGILRKSGKSVKSDESYKLVQDALLRDNIERGFLPKDASLDKEYASVNNVIKVKNLQLYSNYLFINANNIRGAVTYNVINKLIKNTKEDAIFLQRGVLYYVDRQFQSVTKINYYDLSKDQKKLYVALKTKIKNIPHDDYSHYADDLKDYVRLLVGPDRHGCLNYRQQFSLYCNALFDFERKINKAKAKKYYFRDAVLHRDKQTRNASIFLDEGHISLFINLFPNLNAWFLKKKCSEISQNAVMSELKILRELNPKYAVKFAKYFGFNLKDVILQNKIPKQYGLVANSEDVFGKELGHNSLSYLRASLRNIVNLSKHTRFRSTYDKKMVLAIKRTLDVTFDMPEKEALEKLNDLIFNINNSKISGIVYQEIRKIICRPDEKFHEFVKFIQEAPQLEGLDEGQKLILQEFFGTDIKKKAGIFSWEKYIALRNKAIQMQACLTSYVASRDLNEHEISASTQLSQKIIDFYSVDYGIPTVADKLINKLRSYQRWNMFFSYFPRVLSFFDSDKYEKVNKLIDMLLAMPQGAKDDLFIIEKTLNKNICEIFSMNNASISQMAFAKFGMLNKYLFNILTKTVDIKNIVDSVMNKIQDLSFGGGKLSL